MSAPPPPPGLTEADFERIEAAVMETERGRWFLAEYARRIRAESADGLMAALCRIEETLSWSEPGVAVGAGRRLLAQAEAIEERLQDLAWRLREARADGACAAVEAEIFALRALTAPPAAAPAIGAAPRLDGAGAQGELSQRLRSMERPGSDPVKTAAPAALPLSNQACLAEQDPLAAASARVLPADRRHEAFAALDALSPADRRAFFA
jgi:hypothetical protein